MIESYVCALFLLVWKNIRSFDLIIYVDDFAQNGAQKDKSQRVANEKRWGIDKNGHVLSILLKPTNNATDDALIWNSTQGRVEWMWLVCAEHDGRQYCWMHRKSNEQNIEEI